MAQDTQPFIRVRGLHQGFGGKEVLKGVDMDVYRGETLVILGGSGCGKSVLIKHLPRLLVPKAGSVEVGGVEISRLPERELGPIRRQMGYMFQGGALFDSMSVGENIAFPLREQGLRDRAEIGRRVAEVLEIVRLPGTESLSPADLSGGMRKRVSLARAFVHRPACVLYDEPHSGLDPVTAASIDQLICSLRDAHGITNVVITHGIQNALRIADRIMFLADGKARFTGTPNEMRDSDDEVLQRFISGMADDID